MQELAVILRTHATCGKEFHFGTFMEAVRGTVGLHDYNIGFCDLYACDERNVVLH